MEKLYIVSSAGLCDFAYKTHAKAIKLAKCLTEFTDELAFIRVVNI